MPRYVTLILLLLAPFGKVWSLPVSALPGQLQDCMFSNFTCVVGLTAPVFSTGNMEAYFYIDLSSGADTTGYALRYTLTPPSGRYSFDQQLLPFAGDVWLTVQDTYDLAGDSNRITIYTDTVSPQPTNLLFGDSNGLDIAIDLTNDALLSGAGTERTFFIDSNFNSEIQGNMRLLGDFGQDALSLCLAAGCGSSAVLSLIYLQYQDLGNGQAQLFFNPNDPRALLYEIVTGYDEAPENGGSLDSQSFYVVPLPAPVWLMLSGLALLGGTVRRVSG